MQHKLTIYIMHAMFIMMGYLGITNVVVIMMMIG